MRKLYIFLIALALGTQVSTASTAADEGALTLDSCRQLALRHNKTLQMSQLGIDKAREVHAAARTNYLPKISGVAAYAHTGDELSLLSTDQKNALGSLGSQLVGHLSPEMMQRIGQFVAAHPDLAPLVQRAQQSTGALRQGLNETGSKLARNFETDTRNVAVGAVLFTQPLYMGGKIRAYDRITGYAEALAGEKLRADRQEVVLSVDKAYWQVVSLTHKARLATAYRDMLQHLDSDVQKMVKEGVATRSNALAVSVELNKAEMTLTRAEDGLTLSRMLLAQLCGLPLDTPVHLADEQLTDLPASTAGVKADVATAMGARPELRQLDLAQSIYGEKVKIERAAFLPTLALTGGYGMTYPSMFNGFEKKLKGTWSVGLMLKVPIWEWGEGKHKVAAAKADAAVAGLQLQEAREKITLQVNQTALAVNQAVKKLGLTEKSQSRAEENLRMARVGFKEGVVTTSDLLAAQTAWLAAQSDKIDAQIDIMITRAIYEKALGR